MLTVNAMFMTRAAAGENTRLGHPRVIKLSNIVKLSAVVEAVSGLVPQCAARAGLRLCVVSEAGEACSRCPGHGCRGCDLATLQDSAGEVVLKPADNLAVVFTHLDTNLLESINRTVHDASMSSERVKPELELTDCLDTFSSREILDEANPWFCPVCSKHQTATRTLSVWRYPDYLVIYLKRFVYLEQGPGGQAGSVKLDKKVKFPTTGMDLTPYLSGPLQRGGEMFDLYGAVCHYGSSSGENRLIISFTFSNFVRPTIVGGLC